MSQTEEYDRLIAKYNIDVEKAYKAGMSDMANDIIMALKEDCGPRQAALMAFKMSYPRTTKVLDSVEWIPFNGAENG